MEAPKRAREMTEGYISIGTPQWIRRPVFMSQATKLSVYSLE
jgi:hypothetical protein